MISTRKLLTVAGLTLSTVLLCYGKITGGVWAYACAIFVAGHHARDCIEAWQGDGEEPPDIGSPEGHP